jgi:hypothetical protein
MSPWRECSTRFLIGNLTEIRQTADIQNIVIERPADPVRIEVGSSGHDHTTTGSERRQRIFEPSRT